MGKKRIFGPKSLFGKTLRRLFLVIPAETRSGVNVGHFFVAWTVPPSFIDHSPKLRVLVIRILDWPEIARIPDESWKRTPTSEPENFFKLEHFSGEPQAYW